MCGRYALDADIELLIERYRAIVAERDIVGKKEIFPTDFQPIVTEESGRKIGGAKWGFAPAYTKRPLINARGETVLEKPTFRKPFITNRCLIPATSFFEWEELEGKKIKRRIAVEGEELFSMAGLYDEFLDNKGTRFRAYTILTVGANEQMSMIHDRMPVILNREDESKWLDFNENNLEILKKIIIPSPRYLIIE